MNISSGSAGLNPRSQTSKRRLPDARRKRRRRKLPIRSSLPTQAGVDAPGLPQADTLTKPPAPLVIVVNQVRKRFRKDQGIRRTPRPLDILRLLAAHYPQGLIAEKLQVSKGQVSKLRARLIQEGLLQKDGTPKEPIKDFIIEAGQKLLNG